MTTLASRGYALGRALRMAAAQPGVFLLSMLLASLALALPLAAATLARSALPPSERVALAPEISVFVALGTSNAEIKNLQARLQQLSQVASVRWLGRDDALAQLNERSALAALAELKSNPLPDVLILRMANGIDPATVETTAATLRKWSRVDAVSADVVWYRKLLATGRVIIAVALVLGIAAAFGVTLILIGAVRLQISGSLDEIRVLRLVGADVAFIARPYAYLGALTLAVAAAAAIAAVSGALRLVNPPLAQLTQLYGAEVRIAMLEARELALLALLATLLGGFIAAAAFRGAMRTTWH